MSQPIAPRSYALGLALVLAIAAGCDKKSGGADGAAPASSAKVTCMTVRIETNGQAKNLNNRKTRAARESSDAAFIADLLEQARIFKEAGEELTKTGEVSPDPELKKIVIELGTIHTELGQNATALAEAAKAGNKAKEEEIATKGDAISKRQGDQLDKFEKYCDSHGAAPGAK